LLRVSALSFLCVLIALIVGAIIDIAYNGNSGLSNTWREVRRPCGELVVFLLLILGVVLRIRHQLSARALTWSFVIVLVWLFLDPLWPRA
jgi:hypothetical protein